MKFKKKIRFSPYVIINNKMSEIKVPFLPVSNFEPSTVSKYFLEADDEPNEFLMPTTVSADGGELSEEITLILLGMGMEKYIDLFQNERIPIDTFLQLDDSDLQEIGITDPKDREIILKNLNIHQNIPKECKIPENHAEDLVIAKNISHQLLLLQNYCAYVELQMKKLKFTDYKINTEETACMYLKAFTEAALLQSKIICDSIYDAENFDSLIDKILKINDLVLPEALRKSLPEKKKKKLNFRTVKIIAAVGISSVIILTGIYVLKT